MSSDQEAFEKWKAEFEDQYPGATEEDLQAIYDEDCAASKWERENPQVWM